MDLMQCLSVETVNKLHVGATNTTNFKSELDNKSKEKITILVFY